MFLPKSLMRRIQLVAGRRIDTGEADVYAAGNGLRGQLGFVPDDDPNVHLLTMVRKAAISPGDQRDFSNRALIR